MELRPGVPADGDIRILFGVEPPGTALLIAVLEGRDAVQDHYREAVLLASEVLRRSRPDPRTRPPTRQGARSAMPSRSSRSSFPAARTNSAPAHDETERQAGYWSCRAHTSIYSSSVSLRPAERISASSLKYSSRGGPGANKMSIRAGAPLSLEKAWIPPCGT